MLWKAWKELDTNEMLQLVLIVRPNLKGLGIRNKVVSSSDLRDLGILD